jgi:hypothetical protein
MSQTHSQPTPSTCRRRNTQASHSTSAVRANTPTPAVSRSRCNEPELTSSSLPLKHASPAELNPRLPRVRHLTVGAKHPSPHHPWLSNLPCGCSAEGRPDHCAGAVPIDQTYAVWGLKIRFADQAFSVEPQFRSEAYNTCCLASRNYTTSYVEIKTG